ncbi:hypothetical protein SAMN05216378_2715 [Paenibacillus catalpae]|uniref:Beta-galactosidase trimerisation domain-containing protein n=1 Tax=Paenibacillus catalpae TaxID=1045775 RepID=A0A1I1YME4_9BACL|nr:hypothetical protein [Paenibacillus catalpae]SFE20687.1 hypothetical protein SAMN05216378_2715 [Paenibacillus catalpae]
MIRRIRQEELTGFQEGGPYHPSYDLQTDFVMVYGIHGDFQERIRTWKEKGYVVHLMTGVSWGGYQDYLNGKIDGRPHWDEAQKNRRYENIIHGTSVDIPYMVPTIAYADYLTERIRIAVDAGVEAIHLEEPEFWVEGGYSDAFKREWEIYYREPWQAPHSSVDAQYRASKLKAYLYTRTLDRICSMLKEYAMQKYGRLIRFYVPTHSLINYTQWRIVSPESKLLELPGIDGYIAQVWTGTAQTPNVYNGVRKERTFETAYLEYGIMQELVRGTDRRMWFLHDPIADDPKHTWKDYRTNYIRTLVASLLHPHVSRYEVCPWPRRIYQGEYPREGGSGKERIPASYATELQTILNVLGTMEGQDAEWLTDSLQVGLLLADSAMYQRNHPDWSEEATSFKYDGTEVASALGSEFMELLDWSPFYGLALPLLKHGAAVRPVQLDNAGRFPGYLDDYRVLVLSYEYMKPESSGLHNVLAEWVKEGGTLIYVGDGSDDFHGVREWWNQGGKKYASPMEHLFASLGLETTLAQGSYAVGKGCLAYLPLHPSQCAIDPEAGEQLRETLESALAKVAVSWERKNGMALRRGPYVIAAVLDEAITDEPYDLRGKYVDLLDKDLPVLDQVSVAAGEQVLLYDLSRADEGVQLIAAASRIDDVEQGAGGFTFTAYGPDGIQAAARFLCPCKPQTVSIGQEGDSIRIPLEFVWDEGSSTVLLSYANNPSGVTVRVIW